MTVLITLTTAGADSGPFDLYSDLDGYISAFESGVAKAALEAGYASSLVPDYTNIIRVKSNGEFCTNYTDITVGTTTTTTSTSTTTTTTTAAPTLVEGMRSFVSDVSDACGETLDTPCWILTSTAPIPFSGNRVFDDSMGVNPVLGTGQFYRLKFNAYPNEYSSIIDIDGYIVGASPVCP